MPPRAYYNEIDPYAAQWLRNLIAAGHIADGDVDERDIRDVTPDDLTGYTQCHFFAGIGVWSHALRRAGWPDDRPVWTGSCPCQSFSAAGRRKGFADERHLWPHWHYLIEQCRPANIFGEQVASKDALAWLDLVQADLEGSEYACGANDLSAAGFGAPHIRQRLYFAAYDLRYSTIGLADNGDARSQGRLHRRQDSERQNQHGHTGRSSAVGGLPDAASGGCDQGLQQVSGELSERVGGDMLADLLADAECEQRERWRSSEAGAGPEQIKRVERLCDADELGIANSTGWESGIETTEAARYRSSAVAAEQFSIMADSDGRNASPEGLQRSGEYGQRTQNCDADILPDTLLTGRPERGTVAGDHPITGRCEPLVAEYPARPTNGFWRNADWLLCRDERWRPVEPDTKPLVNGAPARVGRLRAYGNAIVASVAEEFIAAYLDAEASGFARYQNPDDTMTIEALLT